MTSVISRPSKFRHIIFADDLEPANEVLNLTPGVQAPSSLDDSFRDIDPVVSCEEAAFIRWTLRQAGVNADDYKPGTLARRLPACLRALRVKTVDSAKRQLIRNSALLQVAADALIIGVTSFFRDPTVYSRLSANVLPGLLSKPGRIGIWSVGCSDGSELYSIAMLLAESGAINRVDLLGTDCRLGAIRRASAGIFDRESLTSVPAELLLSYFHPADSNTWRVSNPLRQRAQFRVASATEIAEPGPFDLILCRNVSIYLKSEVAGRLWGTLQDALAPGGVLMVGKAESPIGAGKLSVIAPSLYRRNRG